MFDRVLPVALIGLVFSLLLSLCVLVGWLPASASVAGGPVPIFTWGLVAVVTMAAVCALAGYMFWEVADLGKPKTGAFVMSFAAAVCTLALPMKSLITGYREAAFHRDMAPRVQAFALKYFDEIDANHDGIITDGELSRAFDKVRLSARERDFLAYLQEQQSE